MGSPKTRQKYPSPFSARRARAFVPARVRRAWDRWMRAGPLLPHHHHHDASSAASSSRARSGSARARDRAVCLTTPRAMVKTCAVALVVVWMIFGGASSTTTTKTKTKTTTKTTPMGGATDASHPHMASSEGFGDAHAARGAPRTGAVRKPREQATGAASTSTGVNADDVDVASRASVSTRIVDPGMVAMKDIETEAEVAMKTLRELRDAVDEDVKAANAEDVDVDVDDAVGVDADDDGSATEDAMKPAMTRAAAAASLRGFEDVDDGREARAPADAAPKMSEDAARALREELEKLRQVPRAKVARPAHVPGSLADDVIDPSKIKVVSLNKPRAYVYESFLSDEEVKHVLDLAIQNGLSKSGVVNATTGGSTVSDIRTSTGTYIGKGHDGVIQRIENRIAAWSQIPVSHGESLQVLHYDPGQQYKPHFDYFFHDAGKKNNRIATVLLYLSDVEEGGETVFPKTNVPISRDLSTFSACGNSGRSIKAKRGDALLFWSMTPGGELDSGSSHAGCPVIKGEKWTATKWMHVNPLGSLRDDVHKIFYEGGPESAVGCSDTNPQCHSWATGGECEKNPAYMRDACAMSCRVCQSGWRDGSYVKPATRE